MFKNLNLQYLFSYSGLIPFFYILIDKYYFNQIKEEIIINFLIYYSILVFVFIGSLNWNLKTKLKNYIIFYGFLPSLIGTFLIILNLYNYNSLILLLVLNLFLFAQLLLDYFIIYIDKFDKKIFYFIRLPLTIAIIILILLTIF